MNLALRSLSRFQLLFALGVGLTVVVAGCGSPKPREVTRDAWVYPTDMPLETFSYMESEVTEIEPELRERPFPTSELLVGRPRSAAGRALEAGEILGELPPGRRVEVPWRVPSDYEYLSRDHTVIGHANQVVDQIDRDLMAERHLADWAP